jgi:drug/metabolite transporter (DMT)-like permease
VIGEVCALAGALSWAIGSHIYGRVARGRDVPAGALNLAKCAAGMAYFAVTALAMSGRLVPDVPRTPLLWLLASGFVGLALGDSSYFAALATIGVRRSLLLLSMAPVFAAVGGALFLGEPLGARDGAAIAAVLAGVAVVVNERDAGAGERAASPSGVLFGLGAALGQAVGSLMSRFAMASGVDALDTAVVRLFAGVVAMVVLAAAGGRLVPWARALARPRLLGAVAGAAFIGTYGGIWLSQIAIGRARSTAVAATLLATSPIFALPLGRWLDAERISARALGGTLLAVAGLGALTLGKS